MGMFSNMKAKPISDSDLLATSGRTQSAPPSASTRTPDAPSVNTAPPSATQVQDIATRIVLNCTERDRAGIQARAAACGLTIRQYVLLLAARDGADVPGAPKLRP